MTTWKWISIPLFLAASLASAQQTNEQSEERQRCALVRPTESIQFHGRTLTEIPDITDGRMRLANALLSSGCSEDANQVFKTYVSERGVDEQASYVAARAIWMTAGPGSADEVIAQVIAKYPEFSSARVLLAGLRVGQSRFDEARSILDDVEPRAPNDLWIYLDRLRIETLKDSPSARLTQFEILGDPQFPPNAREAAMDAIQHSRVPLEQYEAAFRGWLTFDSSTPLDCKLWNYAFWLLESQKRFDDVRALLEPYAQREGRCLNFPRTRMLLAYTYLVAAADIDRGVTSRNAALVEKASALVNDDYSELARWLLGRPQEARLRPFILAGVDVDAVDRYGQTQICNAIVYRNAEAVRAELERGADPNGRCENVSLVERVLIMFTTNWVAERQAVVKVLLEHGAKLVKDDFRLCADPTNGGDCATAMLPILQQYGAQE